MIDNYNGWCIGECIGSGSFGKVYRIYKEDFGHVYEAALKVMELPQSNSELMSLCSEGMSYEQAEAYYKDVIADMGKEFALMSDLKGHSHIVSYEDHSIIPKTDGFGWTIYIKMELLTPLFDYIRDHELHVNDAINIGIHICEALELCATRKIIHRDIKPENIFVSKSGDFKLGDFGIARELDKTTGNLSQKGTKNYMAPEVFRGTKYDATVDIYSLGIVLYRLLNNNRLPFLPPSPVQVRYSDYEQAMHMRLNNELILPPCNASPDLAEIVLKAISYFPERRYQSPTQMKMDLKKVLQNNAKSEDNSTISSETQKTFKTSTFTNGSSMSQSVGKTELLGTFNSTNEPNTGFNNSPALSQNVEKTELLGAFNATNDPNTSSGSGYTGAPLNSSNSFSSSSMGGGTVALNFNTSNAQYDTKTSVLNASSDIASSSNTVFAQQEPLSNDCMYSSSIANNSLETDEEYTLGANRIRVYLVIGITAIVVIIGVLLFSVFQLLNSEPNSGVVIPTATAQTVSPVPTEVPTIESTIEATIEPTLEPTIEPTDEPTPTPKPTKKPTTKPTKKSTTESTSKSTSKSTNKSTNKSSTNSSSKKNKNTKNSGNDTGSFDLPDDTDEFNLPE
ncbi:MAG: serine/threonine protein kinase [Lachnospiraceae bacterium]|nr:serine/threonine protein kinase [Lachnospiraceae bacterium]